MGESLPGLLFCESPPDGGESHRLIHTPVHRNVAGLI